MIIKINKIGIFLITLLFAVSIVVSTAYARRGPAPKVKPLIYNGVKFVPKFYWNAGVVEAYDVKTHKKIWEQKVFDINYKPNLEADNQWIFITSIELTEDKQLLVTNEKGNQYKVPIPEKIFNKE
jgi:hypothetical protein